MGIQFSSVQLSLLVISDSLQLLLGTVGIKKLKIKTLHCYRKFSEEDDILGVVGTRSLFSAKDILTSGHILE